MSSRRNIVSKRMAQHLTTCTMIGNYKKRNEKLKFSFFRAYQNKKDTGVPLYNIKAHVGI